MKKSTTVSKACQPKSINFYHLEETGDIMKLILVSVDTSNPTTCNEVNSNQR